MIQIDEIQYDEDYYDILICFLTNIIGLNLDCYLRKIVEYKLNPEQFVLKLITSHYQFHMKIK